MVDDGDLIVAQFSPSDRVEVASEDDSWKCVSGCDHGIEGFDGIIEEGEAVGIVGDL